MKPAVSFLSAALFAAGLLVFAFPAGDAVAQQSLPPSAENCPRLIFDSVYNPEGGSAGDGSCDCPAGQIVVTPTWANCPCHPIAGPRESCNRGNITRAASPNVSFCEAPLASTACDGITGAVVDTTNNVCKCSDDRHEIFETDSGQECMRPTICVHGILNSRNQCECSPGNSLHGHFCSETIFVVPVEYARPYSEVALPNSACSDQGWTVATGIYTFTSSRQEASICEIPMIGRGNAPVARQFSPSARATGCILNTPDGGGAGTYANALPFCGDVGVFPNGIPARPADFNPAKDRIVLSCPSGFERDPDDGRLCAVPRVGGGGGPGGGGPGGGSAGVESGGSGGKTSGAQRFAIGAGIIFLFGAAVGAWDEDGNLSAFSLSPSADYEYDDGAWRARHGARLNYHNDAWSLWWSAEQTRVGDNSESRFGWGGAWRGEVLRLDAAALISDDSTDLRAGAGAEWDFHGWALRPSWRLRAETAERGVWSGRMGADIAAEWARLGWKIRPSFGATGSLRDAAADEAFMRLRVERTLGW